MIANRRLIRNIDNRGFVMEIWKKEWFVDDAAQALLSVSKPGVIRAWHRHARGQNDMLFIAEGIAKIVYATPTGFSEVTAKATEPALYFIPGNLWHGTMALTITTTIYFITKLYDPDNPDEERLPADYIFPDIGAYNWKN